MVEGPRAVAVGLGGLCRSRRRKGMRRSLSLERPVWSRARTVRMITLPGYLLLSLLMLIVKAVEVSLGP
jgi:hypothetical protein